MTQINSLDIRITRGRKAISLAQKKGMDTSLWEEKLAKLEALALAQAQEVAQHTSGLPAMLSKQEFNALFLLATQVYIPKVSLGLLRECREDIELFGLEYARQKWARFIEVKREGVNECHGNFPVTSKRP